MPRERPDMLLREVRLAEPFEEWPLGTVGTIVRAYEDGALVEVSDSDGVPRAFLSLPYSAFVVTDRTPVFEG